MVNFIERSHVFATAERLEAELGPEEFAYDGECQRDIEESLEPGPPVTVGLDGGYIRSRKRPPGGTGCFVLVSISLFCGSGTYVGAQG
jgi:hypothetical protein